jgi:hypothetical protein
VARKTADRRQLDEDLEELWPLAASGTGMRSHRFLGGLLVICGVSGVFLSSIRGRLVRAQKIHTDQNRSVPLIMGRLVEPAALYVSCFYPAVLYSLKNNQFSFCEKLNN